MALFTVDELREHITSTKSDDALQDLLDAAEEAITGALGPVGPVSELFSRIHGELLPLSRPAVEITEVIEGTTTLASDDYELRSQTVLRRLRTGTNPSWRWRTWSGPISVEYVPVADIAERQRVAIALIRLDLNFSPGLVSQQIGPWRETFQEGSSASQDTYDQQREAILASLGAGAGIR